MDASNLQLTPEQRAAIAAHPDQPLYIEDPETRETYLLVKAGKFPELEEEFIRARLEEGFAAIERGDEENWDSASIKTAGRRILQQSVEGVRQGLDDAADGRVQLLSEVFTQLRREFNLPDPT